eukprot:TRINITY_DN55632_c0_g1_i1.p1 TRINITY_DN55632_c0_g1~~TRINITY_DN55632_c0_g1_i1.p1  ORF type:complete len:259 (+),score=49.96 TRINITY_DN55632_c0_g1_i1:114-890(+)
MTSARTTEVVDDVAFTTSSFADLIRRELHSAAPAMREDKRETMLRTRHRVPLRRARAAPSRIHSRGVFATRAIDAGDLVTLYPGDALQFYPPTEDGSLASTRTGLLYGQHVAEDARCKGQVLSEYSTYAYDVDGLYALVGLPQLDQDPAYLGHLCNDGVAVAECRDAIDYESKSIIANNAAFQSILDAAVAVVALKRIGEGEEILASYGHSYWTALPRLTSDEGLSADHGEAGRDEVDVIESSSVDAARTNSKRIRSG